MVSEFDRKGPAHAAFEALERASGHRISKYGCCVYADDDQDSRWRSFERAWPEIQSAALSAVTAELTAAAIAYRIRGDVIAELTAERDRLRSKWARVESERDKPRAEVARHSKRLVEQQPSTTQQVLDLILEECRYWQGLDEARRGGFACLYAKAKEIADNATPVAQTEPLKPHQFRELVNDLRDVARKYHSTEQLREQIAHTLRTTLVAQGVIK